MLSLMLIVTDCGIKIDKEHLSNSDIEEGDEEVGTGNIRYELSDKGYIQQVILKDGTGVTVVDSKDFLITFIFNGEGETVYDLDNDKRKLTILSSEYPSVKYK